MSTLVHYTCHIQTWHIRSHNTLKYLGAALTLTTCYTSHLSPHATHARNVRVFLVDMVTDRRTHDIFKPTYRNLQNPRFSAKTSIRNLSLLPFYKRLREWEKFDKTRKTIKLIRKWKNSTCVSPGPTKFQ